MKLLNMFFRSGQTALFLNKKDRVFKRLESYFKSYCEIEDDKDFIDDSTWKDLIMDEIYKKVDYTCSTAGEHVLYDMLRRPLKDGQHLNDRHDNIEFFRKNEAVRKNAGKILTKVGRTEIDLTATLYSKMAYDWKEHFLCIGLVSLMVAVLGSFIFIGFSEPVMMLAFMLMMVNMAVHYKLGNKIKNRMLSVQYLGSLVNRSAGLAKALEGYNPKLSEELRTVGKRCEKIGKKSSVMSAIEGLDVIGDYITIIFLIKENSFYSSIGEVEKHKEDLRRLFRIFGEIDGLIAMGQYRENMTGYCVPEFVAGSRYLEVKEIIHPLLENPISNTMLVKDHSILITGSNMSGKSTFLRTIGVNALLAQTVMTCTCKSYKGSIFNIVTSISPEDNILGGKSYYMSEAEAIQRIIEASGSELPCLALIDEIFRGTNPVERVNAAAEILEYLENNNGLVMVATHDLELAKMVENYAYYYFREDVDDKGLVFDYSIKTGISPTRNAVKLLGILGYPNQLIDKIEKRIDNLDTTSGSSASVG